MVESVVQRGSGLFAEAPGSEEDLYRVGIAFQRDGFDASCTWPYDWEGYCKHIVAVLLTWIHDRDSVAVRTPIEDVLLEMDADWLKARILLKVESAPQLAETIGRSCRQPAPVN